MQICTKFTNFGNLYFCILQYFATKFFKKLDKISCIYNPDYAFKTTFISDDSTGVHSLYRTFRGREVMFHVSTMLPWTSNNRQQVLRPLPFLERGVR